MTKIPETAGQSVDTLEVASQAMHAAVNSLFKPPHTRIGPFPRYEGATERFAPYEYETGYVTGDTSMQLQDRRFTDGTVAAVANPQDTLMGVLLPSGHNLDQYNLCIARFVITVDDPGMQLDSKLWQFEVTPAEGVDLPHIITLDDVAAVIGSLASGGLAPRNLRGAGLIAEGWLGQNSHISPHKARSPDSAEAQATRHISTEIAQKIAASINTMGMSERQRSRYMRDHGYAWAIPERPTSAAQRIARRVTNLLSHYQASSRG